METEEEAIKETREEEASAQPAVLAPENGVEQESAPPVPAEDAVEPATLAAQPEHEDAASEEVSAVEEETSTASESSAGAPQIEAAPIIAMHDAAAKDEAADAASDSPPAVSADSDESSSGEKAAEGESSEEEEEGPDDGLTEEQRNYPWYVVHTYSGFEQRVKLALEERLRSNDIAHRFGQILVPQETVVELVRGQKKTSTRKFFPGYILVQVDLDEETWHTVNETPKVTGFVGDARNPMPLSPEEVATLTQQMEGGAERPRPRVQFEEGDAIKVIDGPFTDFNGTVDEVKPDKGKLRVLISIFGRNTPVELDFVQVEKA